MATATEVKTVPITIVPTLPPLPVALAAKWHHLSAFTYFVVSHAITCVYLLFSLALLVVNRASNAKKLILILAIADVMMMELLFSGNSAAVAVELIGLHGNSHLRWNKVCNVFKGYCHQVGAASMVSLISSFLLLFMVILTMVNLHRECKSM
ncbi:hypothetical protein QJS10_CPB04g00722 [Acorus calamus]|uniref:CASP-like protein n=1 Tax=Acorus calamus TaxID=4465 RepID=A0AAV9F0K0_ACOCL|nr:hypothetical protein QJS10_CPB04g00722 [Acorus calamus]